MTRGSDFPQNATCPFPAVKSIKIFSKFKLNFILTLFFRELTSFTMSLLKLKNITNLCYRQVCKLNNFKWLYVDNDSGESKK